MAVANTHKYIPRIEQREENLFVEEYYSSTDTKIYFDDMQQTEIGYINYSLQEQLKPLYGYASRTFDDVSIGNRIVTGTFKIPISNPELQTQPEDINKYKEYDFTGSSDDEDTEEYNKKEDEKLSHKEWVHPKVHPKDDEDTNSNTNTDKPTTPYTPPYTDTTTENTIKEKTEYNEKLDAIFKYEKPNGTATTPYASFKEKVAAFQLMIGEKADGVLTEDIKKKIDQAFEDTKDDRIYKVWAGANLYLSPGYRFEHITADRDMQVMIIGREKYDNEFWIFIKIDTGHFYWIPEDTLHKHDVYNGE